MERRARPSHLSSPPEGETLGGSSIVMPPSVRTAPWTSSSTSSKAPAWPPPSASGRSFPRCSRARSRRADVGLDFDGTSFSFLESWPFLLARPRRSSSALDYLGRRRRTADAGGSSGAARRLAVVLGALVAAGSLADRDYPVVGSAWSSARRAAVLASCAARVAVRSRPPPARPGGRAARCPSTPRARARAAGAVDPVPAARAPRGRRPGAGCSPAGAGARARSTPACASCGERPRSSSSRSSTP